MLMGMAKPIARIVAVPKPKRRWGVYEHLQTFAELMDWMIGSALDRITAVEW
jgi:hypothetical protein